MSKKPAKTKPDAKAVATTDAVSGETPRKRSKIKLGLMVLAPLLVLGAGGTAGWMFYLGPKFFPKAVHEVKVDEQGGAADGHGAAAATEDGNAAEGSHDGEDAHGADPMKVSALPLDVLAETSATHSYALSVLIAEHCGQPDVPALKAASDKEAAENGALVSLSWVAAARRTVGLNDKNCDYLWSEIQSAELKLAKPDEPAKAAPHH